MKEDKKKFELKNPTINQTIKDCQVFNGPISGCVFAMPGAVVNQSPVQKVDSEKAKKPAPNVEPDEKQVNNEELFKFIHPSIYGEQELLVHKEVVNLVTRQGIQEICKYLTKMDSEGKILLPQSADVAYTELVRIGMPDGEGFSKKTFMKYYKK